LFRVLVIEDNQADVDLLLECFTHVDADCTVAKNGFEALRRLRTTNCTSIDLVLLDLNLPGISGHELLPEIRSDVCLSLVPIIILSHSDRQHDVLNSYRLGANCYITKKVPCMG
jgi:two-component system, chemotaxis family, response regulator Rcp1